MYLRRVPRFADAGSSDDSWQAMIGRERGKALGAKTEGDDGGTSGSVKAQRGMSFGNVCKLVCRQIDREEA